MAEIVLMTDEQKKQLEQAWIYTMSRMKDYFDGLQKVMQTWFPVISQAHRVQVKAVHTAYDRKRRSRKRRK